MPWPAPARRRRAPETERRDRREIGGHADRAHERGDDGLVARREAELFDGQARQIARGTGSFMRSTIALSLDIGYA